MFADERQNKIYEIICKEGAVTTAALMDRFSVSVETVRRDLLSMDERGLLTRVHGGAVAVSTMKPFHELKERSTENFEYKNELAEKAVNFISEGDIIGIDSGSTALSFAQAIKGKFSKLTVITHSMDVFEALGNYRDFCVILCGGHYMRGENAFYGQLTLDMLDKLHVGKAFLFPSAVSIKFGISDYQKELYQVQKKLLSISDDIYILADSSKFEKSGLLRMDDMKAEYTYITDSALNPELVNLYRENGINICL